MISFSEARAHILSLVTPTPVVRVPLSRVAGYALAHPVPASTPIPRFDASAMDGFGVHATDLAGASPDAPVRLRVLATVRAGDRPHTDPIPAGCAVKILTGAPVPTAIDAVVVREVCEETDGDVLVARAVTPGVNIRRAGEEFQPGDVVLPAGKRMTPPVIGLLATLGIHTVSVHRKPSIALVVTGSELVRPGRHLRTGQIYDANSFTITAALRELSLPAPARFFVKDDPVTLDNTLARAFQQAEVILVAGGVSVGDYDYVRGSCEAQGVISQVWQIAIKPAKPTYFGTLDSPDGRKLIFGLPGNPVSALLAFQLFVRPALLQMLGVQDTEPLMVTAELTTALRKRSGRHEFVRGVVAEHAGRLIVTPVTGQDSHMLGGLAQANCLIHFPVADDYLPADTPVCVELLNWA
ncbi:MAG: Molybdopterin molybdenumtransferase [bacterium ADurb.Bin429]|nr:MAG: Molybdopterin molybdenumtransferase [bacterium ADurb.Bin429]